jgi:luciferase family oxidoreductase group 1
MVPLSVLDLAPIAQGADAAQAFAHSLDLAQHAEAWGYRRFWLAEHHNMPGIASAATSVVIGHVAAGTKTIRVGSGGVMLPNHAPLVIAEQYGTLEALFPGRIDLGVGRAPGTDPLTTRALRRYASSVERFPQDVIELLGYFQDPVPGQAVQAVPGAGLHVPVWVLGTSAFGAQLAASLGLPYAFTSHFAPGSLQVALELYRSEFQPSGYLAEPYAMAAMNVVAAESDEEARRLFTSVQQQFLTLRRMGTPGPLPPPVESMEGLCTQAEQAALDATLLYSAVGNRETVRDSIEAFLELTQADELMITGQIFDHVARLRSFEIAAEILRPS